MIPWIECASHVASPLSHCFVLFWELYSFRPATNFVKQLLIPSGSSDEKWTYQLIIFTMFSGRFSSFWLWVLLSITHYKLNTWLGYIQVINITINSSLAHWLKLLYYLTSLTFVTMGVFILILVLLLCDPRLVDQPISDCAAYIDKVYTNYLQAPHHQKYLGTRVAYYSNGTATFQLNILTHGDVNPNPGPEVCVAKNFTDWNHRKINYTWCT